MKPLWWWAFKQPGSQAFHSLLLREKSWEPVCFLYFLNTRTFSLIVSLLYKHLRIILRKLWKSSGNEWKHLCYLHTVSPKPLCKQWLETWISLKGPFPASNSRGTTAPCWRAVQETQWEKTNKANYNFKWYELFACSSISASLTLQHGGFVPRDWLGGNNLLFKIKCPAMSNFEVVFDPLGQCGAKLPF